MKSRTFAAVATASLLAAVASAAFADGDRPFSDTASSTRSRADVRAEVLTARAVGSLVPAGQGALLVAPPRTVSLARETVEAETRQARLAGALIPAGEGPEFVPSRASQVARADVKAQVLAARADGTLIPAGEGLRDATTWHPGRAFHRVARGAEAAATLAARR